LELLLLHLEIIVSYLSEHDTPFICMALELLNCAIAHLSTQPGASIVQHVSRPPASTRDFDAWEKARRCFTLAPFARYFLHFANNSQINHSRILSLRAGA
jgi:hypothetical protein